MARKAATTPTKKSVTQPARVTTPRVVTPAVEEQPVFASQRRANGGMQDFSNNPYSLQAMLNFFNRNAALIFMGVGIFVLGFVIGSLWQENKMLKDALKNPPVAAAPGGAQAPAAPEAPAGPLSADNWKKVQADPAGVIGSKNAKVTIVEYTDYQCPFCSRHFTQTYPKIKEQYVDTGKVKIVFKDQPLPFHPNSKIGAQAARCGGDQGQFEKMHDELFGKQDSWVNLSNDDAIKKFGELAGNAGIDGNKLIDCVKSGKFTSAVEADSKLGLQPEIGASGTPTFFINGQPVVGAQDFSVFQTEIDKALKG